MLSILCVKLTIKVKVGKPESFKVGWYPPKKLGRVTLSNQEEFNRFELAQQVRKHKYKKVNIFISKFLRLKIGHCRKPIVFF